MLIRPAEIHLESFIIYNHSIQCLMETKLTLNKVETACHQLQVIKLPEHFQLQANGRQMSDFQLKPRIYKKLNWNPDYKFANIPSTYVEPFEEDEAVISPIIDNLILDEMGLLHVGKVSAISGGTVLLVCICCVGA